MKLFCFLGVFFSFQVFAADLRGDVVGDGKVVAHNGAELQVFKPRPMTELEKRRVHLRREILSRACSLSFWIGKATGVERCMTAIAKEETEAEKDPSHKPDLNKIVSEIKAIRDNLDELQDKDNPNLDKAISGLSVWAQSEVAVLESINIEELEARKESEYAAIAMNMREIQLLKDIETAMTGNFKDIIPKQARDQLAKDQERIRALEDENKALMAKIKSKAKSSAATQESEEDTNRRIIMGY